MIRFIDVNKQNKQKHLSSIVAFPVDLQKSGVIHPAALLLITVAEKKFKKPENVEF